MSNLLAPLVLRAASLMLVLVPCFASASTDLWEGLRSGESVAIMRHALAPGTGDPANFAIDNCATQRNLSGEGVKQATQVGELIRANRISDVNVYSSQWCRCMDTGAALAFEPPLALPLLNSFYRERSTETQQTSDLEQWIKSRLENENKDPTLPAVLVTHQVNITALTGVFPASGEIVFVTVKDDAVVVLGTIETL